MIDTDKYEGHTPAPWDAKPTKSCAWRWVSLGLEVPHDECFSEENIVNLALIADSPLLLAEVKELREWKNRVITYLGNEEMYDFYDWMKEKYGEEK